LFLNSISVCERQSTDKIYRFQLHPRCVNITILRHVNNRNSFGSRTIWRRFLFNQWVDGINVVVMCNGIVIIRRIIFRETKTRDSAYLYEIERFNCLKCHSFIRRETLGERCQKMCSIFRIFTRTINTVLKHLFAPWWLHGISWTDGVNC